MIGSMEQHASAALTRRSRGCKNAEGEQLTAAEAAANEQLRVIARQLQPRVNPRPRREKGSIGSPFKISPLGLERRNVRELFNVEFDINQDELPNLMAATTTGCRLVIRTNIVRGSSNRLPISQL